MRLASVLAMKEHVDQMYRPKDYGAPLVNDAMFHRTVVVDFDGVVCISTGPYARGHFGKPNREGLKLLKKLREEGFHVVIVTARRETDLVAEWLGRHGAKNLLVTNRKVPAIMYIDDHGYHFKDDAEAEEVMKKVRLAAR